MYDRSLVEARPEWAQHEIDMPAQGDNNHGPGAIYHLQGGGNNATFMQ
jgi:hypothetical protein